MDPVTLIKRFFRKVDHSAFHRFYRAQVDCLWRFLCARRADRFIPSMVVHAHKEKPAISTTPAANDAKIRATRPKPVQNSNSMEVPSSPLI